MNEDVTKLLSGLEHPMKPQIEQLRALILGVDPLIQDGIKWNSMSFRTTEWFATLNLRATDRIEFVLHLGAKARANPTVTVISDPTNLLQWKGADRALVGFQSVESATEQANDFRNIIEQWIQHV